jgi:hypothetical protein
MMHSALLPEVAVKGQLFHYAEESSLVPLASSKVIEEWIDWFYACEQDTSTGDMKPAFNSVLFALCSQCEF